MLVSCLLAAARGSRARANKIGLKEQPCVLPRC